MVQRILSFEPDGHIRQYEGNFQAWIEQVQRHETTASSLQADRRKAAARQPASSAGSGEKKPAKLRLKIDEKYELETIDQKVADLEADMNRIKAAMEEAASDYKRLQALNAELEETTARYDTAMNRWLYLQDLVERINQQTS